jgi:SAM-dependent MidA family methyltransferase
VLEFGAGSGRLAHDVIEALAARGVRLAQYAIVEVSADLRARQRQLLAGLPVTWLDAPPVSFEGVVVANEVLDAMPVRVFAKAGGAVLERGVALRDGALVHADRPADAALAAAVAALEGELGPFADGYASEVGFVARAWVAQLAHTLARGAVFLVDYGFPRREYYHPQRLMGTLMCHYRHHAHAQPLWLPGLNDITAHVDWTAMAEAAHEGGLDVLGYTSQAHFLVNCGLLDWLAADPNPARTGRSARLLSEAEMGELFKVLAAGRGIDLPLAGFVRGDRTHTL